ncbi:MAG TPA: 2-oxo-4-hydroxy-4-carboxy-5-ureidoimidazoline decarboxylase [Candidatus Saccharimonadales bacterium]|jgi:2-oxo-4-hydroxy-4-carboxy-5-ureidoimidazoline decarboxylase|nr:2-oxo-4-hydroxy-4-carboxy-5-ureidoimidazoline decarboxylase [Candidatus Saccharimonadales bacterium]
MTIAEINSLSHERFVAALGWVFEHSPWVAERAWARRPFPDLDRLHAVMAEEVDRASRDEQLVLLREHPDLGTRARISPASAGEQSGAGLDSLAPEEYERLQQLNAAYRKKFGFPFLYAVKGSTRYDILQALEQRLGAAPEAEFRQALGQVYRIAMFRLRDTIENQNL